MNQISLFKKYLPKIKKLNLNSLHKENLLTKDFLIDQEENLSMYYSPHNEYINPTAKIIVVGITPGWKQMQTAYKQIIQSLKTGDTEKQMLKKAKLSASLSGQIRNNFAQMLDYIGLQKILDIPTTELLFSTYRYLIHTTSLIKYPVFYLEKNYTGYRPPINHSPLLKQLAYHAFPQELNQINNDALLIPLGKVSEQTLDKVQHTHEHILKGFPHPSGANGHRHKQLQRNYESLNFLVTEWANKRL